MTTFPPQNRLVRKEVALGFVRERPFPEDHIGLRLYAPFMDVESDDVIFDYVQEPAAGLAPARAEDAESELAAKEDTFGEGRASIVDWSIKDHYKPSDVNRWQEVVYLDGRLGADLPRSQRNTLEAFQRRVARDDALRRRKLDNRLEWLIMKGLFDGRIQYNDGKVVFDVGFERPAGQTSGNLPSGASAIPFTDQDSDPINYALEVKEYMRDTYGVIIDRAQVSGKIVRNIMNSEKFVARSGLVTQPGSTPVDPNYTIQGWGPAAARAVFEQQTGITLIEYDAVYWTRAPGSPQRTMNRFSPEDKMLFLPSQASIDALDDNIGFAKTLTSPHPEGNWTSGYYEWEKDLGKDPWGLDRGTGIKAFPVFPHLDLTYVLTVL